jgi:hypothetical protein
VRRLLRVSLPAVAALLTGCSDTSVPSPSTGALVTTAPSPSPTAQQTAGPVTVKLRRFPAGLAVIGINGSKELTVEIKVAGLVPQSSHPARLLRGSCAHPGPVAYPLNPMVIDQYSVADVTTTVPNVHEDVIPQTGWYLAVFRGTAPADQAVPVLCGDIDNPLGQTVTSAGLAAAIPPGGADPTAAGTATLSVTGGQLKAVVDVTGLTPNSSHAVDIMSGSCEDEKPSVHALDALIADGGGHGVETKLVGGVSAIPLRAWFVNVHRAGAFDPVVCGNVGF